VLDQRVGKGEPFGALLAGKGLLVELLHVEAVDPVRGEGQVTAHTAHCPTVAYVDHLQKRFIFKWGFADHIRSNRKRTFYEIGYRM
jgi:hypothetical protein